MANPPQKFEATKVDLSRRGPRVQTNACLVEIYGSNLGKRYELVDTISTIGREDNNFIVVDLDTVSRCHAQVSLKGSHAAIKDLESTNGTFVNDQEIWDETPLRNGDLIKIGGNVFKYISGDNIEGLYHEEIYRMTIIDGLTMIYNKRYFMETLQREMARCQRYNRPLSLIIFDIDHFKTINDSHGHIAGDYVLRHKCQIISDIIRQEEVFARYGGEEFAIILPERSMEKAIVFAEKIRELVAEEEFEFEEEIIPVTISLGIAQLSNENDTIAFINKADSKLYEAKQSGRNCVCH